MESGIAIDNPFQSSAGDFLGILTSASRSLLIILL